MKTFTRTSTLITRNDSHMTFVDQLCFLCLVFLMLSRPFIAALWSPAGKGLTSLLLLVMFIYFYYFPIWYPGSGVALDCIVS